LQQESGVRGARLSAATSSAGDALREQIADTQITPTLTVQQFLASTGSETQLDQLVAKAQQVGGPRWLDEQTCQIQLKLGGETVSSALVDIAAASAEKSPLPPQVLAARLDDWKTRSFSATGMSTTYERASLARPPAARRAWSDVDDDARTSAIALAKLDAASQILQSVRSVQLGPGFSVDDALRDPGVRARMSEWLASRPITRVEYRPDLVVEVRVAASASQTLDALVDALRASPDLKRPLDDLGLAAALVVFEAQLHGGSATGHASAVAGVTTGPVPANKVSIPVEAPPWARGQFSAEGRASGGSAGMQKLRTQRAAQESAIEEIRKQIGELQLSNDLTLNQAATIDPAIAAAIESAVNRARVTRVEFRDDGSVMVRVTLDARLLWAELGDAR